MAKLHGAISPFLHPPAEAGIGFEVNSHLKGTPMIASSDCRVESRNSPNQASVPRIDTVQPDQAGDFLKPNSCSPDRVAQLQVCKSAPIDMPGPLGAGSSESLDSRLRALESACPASIQRDIPDERVREGKAGSCHSSVKSESKVRGGMSMSQRYSSSVPKPDDDEELDCFVSECASPSARLGSEGCSMRLSQMNECLSPCGSENTKLSPMITSFIPYVSVASGQHSQDYAQGRNMQSPRNSSDSQDTRFVIPSRAHTANYVSMSGRRASLHASLADCSIDQLSEPDGCTRAAVGAPGFDHSSSFGKGPSRLKLQVATDAPQVQQPTESLKTAGSGLSASLSGSTPRLSCQGSASLGPVYKVRPSGSRIFSDCGHGIKLPTACRSPGSQAIMSPADSLEMSCLAESYGVEGAHDAHLGCPRSLLGSLSVPQTPDPQGTGGQRTRGKMLGIATGSSIGSLYEYAESVARLSQRASRSLAFASRSHCSMEVFRRC